MIEKHKNEETNHVISGCVRNAWKLCTVRSSEK